MSLIQRGARAGVAVVALGVSLLGQQSIAIAAADSGENDSSSAVVSSPSKAQTGRSPAKGPRSSRTADAAGDKPRRGRVAADPAATVDVLDEQAVPTTDVPAPRRVLGRGHSTDAPHDSGAPAAPPEATPLSASARPASADSNVSAAAITPRVEVARSAAPTPAAAAQGTVPTAVLPAAVTTVATAGAPTPVRAPAVAALGAAVTSFFDSTAHWLSTLPAGPLTEMFQGALLLVRRSFFTVFPTLNVGQTTGQNTDPASFTEDQLRDYLLGLAKQQYGDLYGQTVPVHDYGYPEYLKTGTGAASDTNTQVDGVDEADYVETDGRYLYTAHNGSLTIVRAGDLSPVSESALSGDVLGEYLSGDRLTVITQSGYGWYGPQVKMAYGPWHPWKPQTTVTVYDVTDRTAPAVVGRTVFDGAYQSSRAVDGVIYVVLQRPVNPPPPAYTDVPIEYVNTAAGQGDPAVAKIRYDPSAPIANRTYETWDQYVARVGGGIADLSLPHAYSVDAQGTSVDLGLIAGAGDIVRPQTSDQQSMATVVAVDSAHSAGPGFTDSAAAMVSGWGSAVYMNKGGLYLATTQDSGSSTQTRIDRFAVAGPHVAWQSTGSVAGTLINQFAMDEQNGYLRVATHSGDSNDNAVYVLDTAGRRLAQVGRLTALAPGEQLYAVRFVGDTAYLVTFVRTDPLIAVDLGTPTAPALLGELVVPGFSNYLQPVGDGRLLGIGQEREAASSATHLDATLFDVTDPTRPIQVDREYLDSGYQWSWSEGQFDHHALLYSPEDGLLVVPVSASGYDAQSGYRYDQYLSVLRVGPSGIEVVGEIHPRESAVRTVRIGDVLYAVGDTSVTAYRLSDLSEIGSTAAAPSVV